MATAEPIIMPGYQGEAIHGPYDDPDGDYEDPEFVGVVSVEQAFELFSAAAPEGWRVELVEGEIYVVPPANGEHEEIVSEIVDQVAERRATRTLRSYTGIGLNVPGASGTGHVIPDLAIAPKGSFADEEEWHDPAGVLLVAEVTSTSTADRDREEEDPRLCPCGNPRLPAHRPGGGRSDGLLRPVGRRLRPGAEAQARPDRAAPRPPRVRTRHSGILTTAPHLGRTRSARSSAPGGQRRLRSNRHRRRQPRQASYPRPHLPDLIVTAREAMLTDGPLGAREIHLAIEIVSPSNPDNDDVAKSRDYPAMGIAHYLILDPRDGTWTYQWDIDTSRQDMTLAPEEENRS